MLNPFKDVNWNPNTVERRKFARSLVIGFPIIAVVLAVMLRVTTHAWKPFPIWLGAIGFIVGLILWALPQISRPLYMVWYSIGCVMGLVVGNALLAALFYLVLTPIGVLLRFYGRKPLRKMPDRSCTTYWVDAQKVVDLKRYYRQF